MSLSLSRREFLVRSGTAGVAVVAGPLVLTAKKSDPSELLVGTGEHTYLCEHDWLQLPGHATFGEASHGVAIDEQGLIYVTHYGKPGSIFVFDPEGRFIRSMGEFHVQNGQGRGHGIDIRKESGEEFLYLSSSSSLGWAKTNLQGEIVWKKGVPEESGKYSEGAAFRPTNASFGPDGVYFLGDGYGSHYLHQYDQNDNYVRTIGGKGNGPGQFRTPHGQWLDERDGTPKLVVADRANKRLQYFSPEGKYLSTVEGLLFPADIDIRGDVMLVPDLHARITLFDRDNNVITHLGNEPDWTRQVTAKGFPIRKDRERWRAGRFVHPHDACFDRDGNILVAEWVVTGRVSRLRKANG